MTTEAVAWVGAVGIVTAVAASTYAITQWVSKVDRITDEALGLLEQFNVEANILLDDDRTPVSVAEFIVLLSQELGKSRLATWFVSYRPGPKASSKQSVLSKDLTALPADLVPHFIGSVLTALFASASVHPLGAAKLRQGLIGALEAATAQHVSIVSEPDAAPVPAAIKVVIAPMDPTMVLPKTRVVPEQMRRAIGDYSPAPQRTRHLALLKREPVAA
jgi:hypothetical protein